MIKNIAKKIIGFMCYIFLSLILKSNFKLKNLKYDYLWYVQYFSADHFKSLKEIVVKKNVSKKKKSVSVAFVVYTGAMWNADILYKKLKKDTNIKTDIVVGRFAMTTDDAREKTYRETIDYFLKKKQYDIITEEDSRLDLNAYDLVFYMTPYLFANENMNIRERKLSQLICYASYSYMLADNPDKFSLPAYMLSWKFFCDTPYYRDQVEKKSPIYTGNAVYCGYLKMDEIFRMKPEKKDARKTIIFAPHHSLSYTGIKSATFDKNYKFMLQFAKNHKDTTYWIYKPHPMLRDRSVEAGLFENVEAYDEYQNEWNRLENGRVSSNGDYLQLFIDSDAMITDSVSFLAEYQFSGKPLLLLESGMQVYNEFGNALNMCLYKCSGDDYDAISSFVRNVTDESDPMRDERKKFFERELNYYSANKKTASGYVYDTIKDLCI